MPADTTLPELLERSARLWPDHVAVEEPPHEGMTYRELDALSSRLRNRLRQLGVHPGDRVGIYLRKSIDAVAAIFGALKADAAYVPVDPSAPAWRSAYILHDCSVKAVVMEQHLAEGLLAEIGRLGELPQLLLLDDAGGGWGLQAALERGSDVTPAPPVTRPAASENLAYILYTSGSTGRPKGVMLSHRNAMSFIDWCSETFTPDETDRFSSHAPFHFDLSILDLFVPLKHGATVVLIGAEVGKDPQRLAQLIAERQLSIWYSTPSILTFLAQYGKLERHDCSSLRLVLFAGEVFPVKHLRAVKTFLPQPRYFNLYGPTETNVCTYYEIPEHIPTDRTEPYPIGKACSHLQTRVTDEQGTETPPGAEGELCVSGPAVMKGYWNLPEQTARAFLRDGAVNPWYQTGDIVVEHPDGNYHFVGRRDRMVKRRGYRIELGEIEAGFYRHPAVREAAVVALHDVDGGLRIKAWLSCRDEGRPSLIELKRFCADTLPLFMVPDQFAFLDVLPKTSTDKIDYQRLLESG